LSTRTKAEAFLVVVTAIWGCTFVVVKGALADASPLPFLAVRFLLAGLLLLAILGRGHVDRRTILPGSILGVFLFAGYLLQTWGLMYTTPSKSAFLTGFSVILVPVIMMFSGFRRPFRSRSFPRSLSSAEAGERESSQLSAEVDPRLRGGDVKGDYQVVPGPANFLCAALGLLGIYLLVAPSGMAAVNKGDILTLAGALSFAVHIVLVGHYTKKYSFLHLVPVQILVVGLLSLVALPFVPHQTLHLTGRLVGAILVTAVLATGVAFSVQNWAQQYTPAAHTALIFALEPVFAALSSWLVIGEHFGGKVLLGSGLILAGMVISEVWGGRVPTPVEG
jgi:drug/metabolite transporter (DMT)-like permease